MVERKRSLRPLETLQKKEREQLYTQIHSEVQSYHYESQTIRLLKKEKKQREIEEQLAGKMDEFRRKNAELETFSMKLKEDQKNTRDQIDLRRNIIQNFDHKAKQESEKYNKENQAIAAKESEIRKKQEQKDKVLSELEEIDRQIEHYSIYKNILEEVVRRSEDYEEISQLILRCRTLKKSVDNLSQQYRKLEEETETEKESFFKEFNKLNEEIGVCRGNMHSLEGEIEDLNIEISKIQSKQEQQRISRIEQKAQRAKIELSIKNIYSKAIQSKPSIKSKPIGEEEKKVRFGSPENKKLTKTVNPEQEAEDPDKLVLMLQKIRERFIDLKRINSDFEKETSLSKPTLLTQSIPIEEHTAKTKIQKKASAVKPSETNRTIASNKD